MYLYDRKGERHLFEDREIESLGDYNADSPTALTGSFNVMLKAGNKFKAHGTIQDYDMVLKVIVRGFNPGRRRQ